MWHVSRSRFVGNGITVMDVTYLVTTLVCVGPHFLKRNGRKKRESKNRTTKIEYRCMQVKTEMKPHKTGNLDPEGGSQKRQEK